MGERMRCLDTYALVEILEGNPAYRKIIGEEFVVADCTLAEFYALMCKRPNERTARYWLEKFRPNSRQIGLDVWIEAVKFRVEQRKKNLSLFDCLGYAFCRANKYVFLTGDKEFEGMEGVEYIK